VFLQPETPVLLTLATITPSALIECCATMNVNLKDVFFLNLGNHCPNIITSVIHMDGSKDFTGFEVHFGSPQLTASRNKVRFSPNSSITWST
jgi:hypothetical protein